MLEAGVLSGRQGTWIGYTADLLLEQAIQKAKGLVKSEFNLTEQDFKNISKIIALSAIKFEFLKQSPEKKLFFHGILHLILMQIQDHMRNIHLQGHRELLKNQEKIK